MMELVRDFDTDTDRQVMTNVTGILPTGFSVLILPDPVEETFANSKIIKPVEMQDKEKYATTNGRIVAAAPAAFSHVTDKEWDGTKPQPGDHVVYTKYAGFRSTSKKDGKDYLLIRGEDIHAKIED